MKTKLFIGLIILTINLYSQFQTNLVTDAKELVFDTVYGPDSISFTIVSFEDMWYTGKNA